MGFPADFTAIDFETANRRNDSACQLGLVKVRDGCVVDQACWLIRPRPFYFQRSHIQIHGITPEKVENEPEFGDLWPEIAERIETDCLVAHNASFDLRVLIETLRRHQQTIPELTYTCTRAIARRTWTHHRRYGLKPLSNWLGIRFQHHDALEDSLACAKILLAAGIDQEAKSLEDLEKRLRLRRGKAGAWGLSGPTTTSRPRKSSTTISPSATASPARNGGMPFWLPNQIQAESAHPDSSNDAEAKTSLEDPSFGQLDIQRLLIRAEFIRPLAGKQIVLTGRFRVLSREDACELALRSGATCQQDIDESTDFLVLGDQPSPKVAANRASQVAEQAAEQAAEHRHPASMQDLAAQLQKQGQTIQVVNEDQFIKMVGSPNAHR